jgi:uncharacterized protein with HEPN domain
MTEKESKFLYDIVNPINLIEDFTENTKSFKEYENNFKTKSAVERHLAIIGEAVNKFLKISKDYSFKNGL